MVDVSEDEVGRGRDGALAALKEASAEQDIVNDYRTIAGSFSDADYEAIIALAWRHQFNDDRLNFKREIREMQQHVCEGILKHVEDNA